MINYKYKITAGRFLTVLLFMLTTSVAQWNAGIEITREFNDNPFRSPVKVAEDITATNIGLQGGLGKIFLGYYGSYNNFSKSTERNYYWHQAGFWQEDSTYLWGVYFEQRIDKSDYNYYDFSGVTAYLKKDFVLSGIYLNTGLSFKYTSYSQLSEYNNLLFTAGFIARKSFETRTTIFLGADFNYKNYSQQVFSETGNITPYLFQGVVSSRIAQAITETTGLAVQFNYREILDGTGKDIRLNEYSYGDESALFDDPVSYNGSSIGAELTQLLPAGFKLSFSYYYNDKDFQTQGIYTDFENYLNEPARSDEQNVVAVSLSKDFLLESFWDSALTINVDYYYIKNESNSYWFNYTTNNFVIGLGLQF